MRLQSSWDVPNRYIDLFHIDRMSDIVGFSHIEDCTYVAKTDPLGRSTFSLGPLSGLCKPDYRSPLSVGAAGPTALPARYGRLVNTKTGVYHLKSERWYGATRRGAYVCRKEANAEGDRMTRNGQ